MDNGLSQSEAMCQSEGLCQAISHPSSWAKNNLACRLINERRSWEQNSEDAQKAVEGLQQLIGLNIDMAQVQQRAALEGIWIKQVNKSNLFGGRKDLLTGQLSASQVRLGSA
ncbi:MAG: hypothetical protein JSS83_04005 [Cyanobacteria bacterium SZAS LIN-3]|nr:hypothetical protein [Cyanobacteria bacterium SZAS LIN-3]MBS2007981.1 hypothetical protein [Cyanobacteria bacterium SZAS TMP-1]